MFTRSTVGDSWFQTAPVTGREPDPKSRTVSSLPASKKKLQQIQPYSIRVHPKDREQRTAPRCRQEIRDKRCQCIQPCFWTSTSRRSWSRSMCSGLRNDNSIGALSVIVKVDFAMGLQRSIRVLYVDAFHSKYSPS